MSARSRLIVLGGLPGTGKTTIAEFIADRFSIPLFSRDQIEAAVVVSDLGFPTKHDDIPNLSGVDFSVLSMLAEQQLKRGQSAILDSTARSQQIRDEWLELSTRFGATHLAIHCICSDPKVHRGRIEGRERGIPGWYELSWANVEDAAKRFDDWTTDCLICDSCDSLDSNLTLVEEYIRNA